MLDAKEGLRKLLGVIDVLVELIETKPSGFPQGELYALLYAMTMGMMNLDQFNTIVNLMVEAGRVRKEGWLLYAIKPTVGSK